jgi:monovalent cation:H+ antiporter-2, CPA2 family
MDNPIFVEVVTLLAFAVIVIAVFRRLRMPSALGYLFVGVLVGPHAFGLVPDADHNRVLAEFGIVFLLFTIGLSFSLPQILAMRSLVFVLGSAQVGLTTVVITLLAWTWGLPLAAAFVVGAVVAQSSTSVISKQLIEQGEENSRHGRLGISMSVFQDVTAVPLLIVIPVLGGAAADPIVPLAVAMLKAIAAFGLVLFAGRWVLGPLFHEVAARRSPELFTLTVLLVTLVAAGITDALGLSMALGAFLAGVMLGDTAFRHQIESTIRPFRDVLLGLFFITIGMLLDVSALPGTWHLAALGAVGFVALKFVLVALVVKAAGVERATAIRVGVVLAIGGEFGFALLAIGLADGAIEPAHAQLLLTAVLFSILASPFLIRCNGWVALRFGGDPVGRGAAPVPAASSAPGDQRGHVIICGYGRIGQNVARFLEEEKVPYVALDMDPERVRDAHASAMPVYYGDSSERDILEAVGAAHARLLVVSHEDLGAVRKLLHHARNAWPDLRVMVRTRDERPVDELMRLGATEVVPETHEASIMIASHALLLAGVSPARVLRRVRGAQANRYQLLREVYRTDDPVEGVAEDGPGRERLHSISLSEGCAAVGQRVGELDLADCRLQALVHDGDRDTDPSGATRLAAGDTVVIFGLPADIEQCEANLMNLQSPADASEGESPA